MKNNPVGWFEIYAKNLLKARAFYEGVLGVRLTALENADSNGSAMWAFPMEEGATGAAGALASMNGQQPGGNGTVVYFTCADCAVEAKRAPTHGGKIIKEKYSIGEYGFVALVADPEGNVVGLHSTK
jgi:predicted enzyme related to lactoylglutathione lyase